MGLLLRRPLEVIRLSGLSDQSSDANIVQKTVANSVQSDSWVASKVNPRFLYYFLVTGVGVS